jgi:RHS repeat-associated protein
VTRRERRYDGGLLKTFDLVWDADCRLRRITEGGTTRFSADYRGDGLRVGKWDSWTAQHNYTWGPGGIVFDSSGSTVLTPGLAQRSNGVDRFFQEDWIGSARYLTDSSGNAAPSALRYDAFGNRTALAGPSYPTEFEFVGTLGYESEYQDGSDPGLGIDYLQQRYYDPAVGRFISRDPIGFDDGLNLYAYVDNGPVLKADPTGEFAWLIVLGVAAYLWLSSESPADIPSPGYRHRPVYGQMTNALDWNTQFGNGGLMSTAPTPGPPLIYRARNGVRIRHYYHDPLAGTPQDHSPAHAHVDGGGPEVRIGEAGHPLKGDPELTAAQRAAVEEGRAVIRNRIKRIGRYLRYLEEAAKAAK